MKETSNEQKDHLRCEHSHSRLGDPGGGFHGPCAPSLCRTGRPVHWLSNLCLVHCRSLEGPRSRCAGLAATPSAQGMGLCRSLLRDVRRGGISCSGRRSHREICRATGFHLSHVGLLVVPAGPGNALNSPLGELTLWSHCSSSVPEGSHLHGSKSVQRYPVVLRHTEATAMATRP